MIISMNNPSKFRVTNLSDGWFMVEPLTKEIVERSYSLLDEDEINEIESIGIDRKRYVKSFLGCDHTGAVFAGPKLIHIFATYWKDINGKKCRFYDSMSTRTVREENMIRDFVKHTSEVMDAFSLNEPTDEFYTVCKSDFYRSRKWIEKVCGFKEIGNIGINNVWHTIYCKKEV